MGLTRSLAEPYPNTGDISVLMKLFQSGKCSVQLTRGFTIRFVCFFSGSEVPQTFRYVIVRNGGTIAAGLFDETNPFESRSAFNTQFLISHVFLMRCISEILPRIVSPIPITMIDKICRPRPRHIQDRQSMAKVENVIYSDGNRTSRIYPAGFFANGRPITGGDFPSEDASLRVVVENFTQVGSRESVAGIAAMWNTLLSHSTLLQSVWSGPGETTPIVSRRPLYTAAAVAGQA